MKYIILLAVLLFSFQSICAQDSELHLIDSHKVIEDIKLCGNNSDFYTDLDYEALLYLFPNEFDLLTKIKPKTLHLTRYKNYPGAIRDLPFQSKEIKNLFDDREKLKHIIKIVSSETDFEYGDIYYRSPNKAFVNISGNMWSSSYGFELVDSKLKLKHEIKNIE